MDVAKVEQKGNPGNALRFSRVFGVLIPSVRTLARLHLRGQLEIVYVGHVSN